MKNKKATFVRNLIKKQTCKNIFRISYFILLLPAAFAGCKKKITVGPDTSHTGSDVTVSVNENKIIREASKDLLGMSHDMAESQSVLMNSFTSLDLKSDYFVVMKNLPLPLNRGGVSQDYMWKKTLGPLAERTGFPNQWYPTTPMSFGIVEWLKSVLAITPDAKFVWTFNMRQNNPAQDAADLAEFLTGDGIHDPNGGTNWAQRRIGLGIAGPVNVSYELGNELDNGEGTNVVNYIRQCKDIINAVRKVDPNARFTAFAKTAPWSVTGTSDGSPSGHWRDWHNKILQNIGNDIDYISLHPYYLGYSLAHIDEYINSIRDDIALWEHSPGDTKSSHQVKIYISEHGVWPLPDGESDFEKFSYKTHDLEGSLGSAEFINRMYHRPEVAMVTLHAFTSGPWFAINKEGSGALYLSGIGEMMQIMNESLGTNVVESNVSGDFTDITKDNT